MPTPTGKRRTVDQVDYRVIGGPNDNMRIAVKVMSDGSREAVAGAIFFPDAFGDYDIDHERCTITMKADKFVVVRIPKGEPDAGPDHFRRPFDSESDAEDYIDRNDSPDNPFRYEVRDADA